MSPDPCWPQWLSFPAAPGWELAVQAVAPCARLLTMVADHGVARAIPGVEHGRSPRVCAWRSLFDGCVDQSLEDCHLHDGCGLVTRSLLDLGRHAVAGIDPAAQRFDLGPGTLDSRLSIAMDGHQLDLALSAGRHAVERAKLDGVALIWAQGVGAGASMTNQVWRQQLRQWPNLFMPGDAAGDAAVDAASILAFSKGSWRHHKQSEPLAGAETSDSDVVLVLKRHSRRLSDPYEALGCIGGFEHAALVGSALAAAQLGLPWVAVGESGDIARLLALRLNPSVEPWLLAESWLPYCLCESGRSGAGQIGG